MKSTKMMFIAALTLMLGTLAESLVEGPSEPQGPSEPGVPIGPAEPIGPIGPICKIPYYPVCKPPLVRKCDYNSNGCPTSCYCQYLCPRLSCLASAAYRCPHGVLLDKNGCLTCTCRPPCCPPCKKYCPMGYIYSLDNKGCRTCTCKD